MRIILVQFTGLIFCLLFIKCNWHPVNEYQFLLRQEKLITIEDFHTNGQQLVNNYINDLDSLSQSDIRAVIDETSNACVRIEIKSSKYPARSPEVITQSIYGTGVLFNSGSFILTSQHLFDHVQAFDDMNIQDVFGNQLETKVIEKESVINDSQTEYDDWVIIKNLSEHQNYPSIYPGKANVGNMVYIFGYPEGMGLDPNDRVERSTSYSEVKSLKPVVTIGKIINTDPLIIKPVIGSSITGGMSGGPVVNEEGILIGIITASRYISFEDKTILTYSVTGVMEFDSFF